MAKRKTISQLSDLTPDTANANKGTERGRFMVEASLTETGAGRSIVADKDGRIIAGNKTLEAWAGMGGAVKVVETDGHELVVVQRTDLDLSDPKGKARKLAYYDNRAGQVGLEWDAAQLLADVNAGVDLAAMFKADEIAELLAGVKGGAEADAEPQIDQAEELNKKWQVKPGDLWRIGAHRLLCGDSTKAADVARVMGGEKADMMLTDPPYGVDYEYSGSKDDPKQYEALADGFWAAKPEARLYMLTVGNKWNNHWFRKSPNGFLVWFDKTKQSPSGVAHLCKSELILIFGKVFERFAWDTLEVQQPRGDGMRELHTCPKPLELWQKIVEAQTGALTLYEPFAGSGTTLVACENLGRKCRAIEISPAYCAVILERMAQAFPKLEITRDDGAG